MNEYVNKSEEPLILKLAREMEKTSNAEQFCFKALKHVCFLLEAERCSFYRIRNSIKNDEMELTARLLDVTPNSSFENVLTDFTTEVILPINRGILGHVARSKRPLNVIDATKHKEFDKKYDERLTKMSSSSLLCYPVVHQQDSKLIGVVEVINKQFKKSFSRDDEEVLEHFILLCSLAITSCQKSFKNQLLQQCVELQHDLTNKIVNMWPKICHDDVMKNVMTQLYQLIECSRYTIIISLFEVQNNDDVSKFSRCYDVLRASEKNNIEGEINFEASRLKKADWILNQKVIEKVLYTKKSINIPNILPFSEYSIEDKNKSFVAENVFCMPIYGSVDNLLGVLHLANKPEGFSSKDEEIIQSLKPYIACGIIHCISFNSIANHQAKCEVNSEMLNFHLMADDKDTVRLNKAEVPTVCDYNVYDFKFCDENLCDDETILISLRMFQDINAYNLFGINKQTMIRWLLTVKKSYRDLPYHNWRHGFNVAHTMSLLVYYMSRDNTLPYLKKIFSDEEKFCLVVACLCHDVDHRGTNNSFLIRSSSPLATLYSSSTLENHHYDNFIRILSIQGNNIFSSFSQDRFEASCQFIRKAILATDLGFYFQRRERFRALLKVEPEKRDFTSPENKSLLVSMMMTTCDLSQTTKPWEAQYQTAKSVTSEFYQQGDREMELFGSEPMPMMNRKFSDDLAKMQIGFIDGVCSMVFEMMSKFCSSYKPMLDGMLANRSQWQVLSGWLLVANGNEKIVKYFLEEGRKKEEERKEEKSEKYESLWVKYWNVDPDNFIWGVEPDVIVPDVVIERVVFSPKKKSMKSKDHNPPATSVNRALTVSPSPLILKKKKKNNKVIDVMPSSSCDASTKKSRDEYKNSKMCLMM